MPELPSLTLAESILRTVVRAGIRDIIYCPGSRNAPFAQAMGAVAGVRIHKRIDERSATFLALGLGRAGRPAAVITTSGTAVANCLPAVVEASYAGVPMVIISADRPRRLIDSGASQTIRQEGIFSSYALCLDVDRADEIPGEFTRLLAEALGNRAVVHINAHLDVPLVAETAPVFENPTAPEAHIAIHANRPKSEHEGTVSVDLSENTLVIAGDGAWEVPGLEDVPTIAEPTAPAPFNPVHPLAAKIFHTVQVSREINDVQYVVDTKPKQVIVIGHPTLHREVMALLQDPEIRLICLSRTALYTDPAGHGEHAETLKITGEPSKQWLKICEGASSVAAEAVRNLLEGEFNPEKQGLLGLHVAAAVADTLGDTDVLFVGASNPIRDFSLIGLPFAGVETYSPRGAAGIDGSISQAIGVALATQTRNPGELRSPRTIAVMGDITFLHEVGGLAGASDLPIEDLTLIVVNDRGGSIFDNLEPGRYLEKNQFEDYFSMPQHVSIENLAAAYDLGYAKAENLEELLNLLDARIEKPQGFNIIEVICDRAARPALHDALDKAVTLGY
ncbi:MAG: 2-succinyl-5-enolpyruvyl-6-hydroxy-3-cyclohexene-1-carboxylic-acid synthase [Corynebacterium sp.]|nr:2-succinyl-5-enolpyruvyl-6-hydroxy-3-cyclohexene-1-carboxylic-acid synthase [Corynebacterium sp.]